MVALRGWGHDYLFYLLVTQNKKFFDTQLLFLPKFFGSKNFGIRKLCCYERNTPCKKFRFANLISTLNFHTFLLFCPMHCHSKIHLQYIFIVKIISNAFL